MNEIQILAVRFAPLLFLFPCTASLYNAFTYAGLALCRKDLLTSGIVWVNAISFSYFTVSFWFFAIFSRRLAVIRVQFENLAKATLV
eukprot:c6564_g1_i1.p1 GENE.c6564_g1_i1~~c6564_g1_i1.p1  ORF type:complete len:100 (-),score=32.85 c6564_g1_i1:29-289(-)